MEVEALMDGLFGKSKIQVQNPILKLETYVAKFLGLRTSYEESQIINKLFELTQKNSELFNELQLPLDL